MLITINLETALDSFLAERKDKFPKPLTPEQRFTWLASLAELLNGFSEESDYFYDTMPEDVEEL